MSQFDLQCNNPAIYQSVFNAAPDSTISTIVILSIFLPIQLICLVWFVCPSACRKRRKNKVQNSRTKIYDLDPKKQNVRIRNQGEYESDNYIDRLPPLKHPKQKPSQPQESPNDQEGQESQQNWDQKCYQFVSKTSPSLFRVLIVFSFVLLGVGLVTQLLSVLANNQALFYNFSNSECLLNQTIANFTQGNNEWIGLNSMAPNITKIALTLNTRVKTSKNAILGLLLNGTNAQFRPIGFPNETDIFNESTNSSERGYFKTSGVATYIDYSLRQWLSRNSSISQNYGFPICQEGVQTLIPHPLIDNSTIELNFMDNICSNLTAEVNQLVANGQAVDDLLELAQKIETIKFSMNDHMEAYNETMLEYSLRGSEYSSELGSTGADLTFGRAASIVLLVLYIISLFLYCLYWIVAACQMRRQSEIRSALVEIGFIRRLVIEEQELRHHPVPMTSGPRDTGDQLDLREQQMIMKMMHKKPQQEQSMGMEPRSKEQIQLDELLSITDRDELTESELNEIIYKQLKKIKRQEKSKKLYDFLMLKPVHLRRLAVLAFITNTLIGLFGIYSASIINAHTETCSDFSVALTSSQDLESLEFISSTQLSLLRPIQQCTAQFVNVSAGANRSAQFSVGNYPLNQLHFLQSTHTVEELENFELMYNVSRLYNSSTPSDMFNSISLEQIEILKNYLLHMETMPVKSQNFNIEAILEGLNSYSNGSSSDSPQIKECGSAVLEDQFVFNSINCLYTLIDYPTEFAITHPRCLQIPTYNGSAGTEDTNLNNAQHTIELNATCPNMTDFFDQNKPSCFLGKRLNVLTAAGCSSTADEYARRVNKLLNFSISSASYTNAYLQNLRNYFGIYAVMSSNLTEFFNGANMSETLDQIGFLANNVINRTSCAYVASEAVKVYDQYCPVSNSLAVLMYDSYVWMFVSFFIFWFGMCLGIGADTVLRVLHGEQPKTKADKDESEYGRSKRADNKVRNSRFKMMRDKEDLGLKESAKKLQESESTLRNEDPQDINGHLRFHEVVIFDQKESRAKKQYSDFSKQYPTFLRDNSQGFQQNNDERDTSIHTKLVGDRGNPRHAGQKGYSKQVRDQDHREPTDGSNYSLQIGSKNRPKQADDNNSPKEADNGNLAKQADNGNLAKQADNNYAKQADNDNFPKQTDNDNLPKQTDDDNFPKQADNDNLPKQTDDENLPKQADNDNLPKQADDDNHPQWAEKNRLTLAYSKNPQEKTQAKNEKKEYRYRFADQSPRYLGKPFKIEEPANQKQQLVEHKQSQPAQNQRQKPYSKKKVSEHNNPQKQTSFFRAQSEQSKIINPVHVNINAAKSPGQVEGTEISYQQVLQIKPNLRPQKNVVGNVVDISKQQKEDHRLRVVELGQILKNTIEMVNLQQNQGKKRDESQGKQAKK